jgi:hypothetical protein
MPDQLIQVALPAAELDRLVREAETRGGRWFHVEAVAELALWRDLEAFGGKRPSMRALAARWSMPLATVHWLITGVLSTPHDGTTHIDESSEHAIDHIGAGTLEDVSSRQLVTTIQERLGQLHRLCREVERVRGLDRDDLVSEMYARALHLQTTRNSFFQPHRSSLGGWVYRLCRSRLLHLLEAQTQPMVAADPDGLARAAERHATTWGARPRNSASRRKES